MNWNERFELAKAYYEHHGDLKVKSSFKTKNGFEFDEDGFELGKWLAGQRQQYRLKELTTEHYEKLKSIGAFFGNVNNYHWDEFYKFAQIYLEHHGNLSIAKEFKTTNGYEHDSEGKCLGAWFAVQCLNYQHQKLAPERKEKIKLLFERLEQKKEEIWEKMYHLAQIYYANYGHSEIAGNFKTKNGYVKDEEGFELGKWISKQRRDYKKGILSQEKIVKLEEINMFFGELTNARWEMMYSLAKTYYKHYGNLKIPRDFKTKNGYEISEKGLNLGHWINTQYTRNCMGYMTKEQFEKLSSVGMVFENQRGKKWDEYFRLAKAYYEYHHDLNVPANFKTINGYSYDEKGKPLKIWLNEQRKYFYEGRLSKKHIEQLKSIDMSFDRIYGVEWEKMYNLARKYYEHYHTLEMPTNFITINGYEYDSKGEKLGAWITRQRNCYRIGTLSKKYIDNLTSIGMIFENMHDVRWEKMYSLAVEYYKHYHNLKVDFDFITENGIDYDANGIKLGSWLNSQRTSYKSGTLSQERIIKLQAIGMIFDIRIDKKQNQSICLSYDIDYKTHKKEIDSIPHREFAAKINYLNLQGIPFVVDNRLHPIFFESDINMQARYGVSLEQIVKEYKEALDKVKRL